MGCLCFIIFNKLRGIELSLMKSNGVFFDKENGSVGNRFRNPLLSLAYIFEIVLYKSPSKFLILGTPEEELLIKHFLKVLF